MRHNHQVDYILSSQDLLRHFFVIPVQYIFSIHAS